jgi:outer membrane protein OmpA-like peptidoglycan-associated protein
LVGVGNTADQANTTAGQAMQQAQTNAAAIQSNTTDIDNHTTQISDLTNGLNYAVVESGNVTFGFNKADLTKDAKAALDLIAQKANATQRPLVEVVGYTDHIGSKSYNLALSRRRAEAVARYLMKQNVPLKGISLIGMGEEQTPELLAAEVQAFEPNASKMELRWSSSTGTYPTLCAGRIIQYNRSSICATVEQVAKVMAQPTTL